MDNYALEDRFISPEQETI